MGTSRAPSRASASGLAPLHLLPPQDTAPPGDGTALALSVRSHSTKHGDLCQRGTPRSPPGLELPSAHTRPGPQPSSSGPSSGDPLLLLGPPLCSSVTCSLHKGFQETPCWPGDGAALLLGSFPRPPSPIPPVLQAHCPAHRGLKGPLGRCPALLPVLGPPACHFTDEKQAGGRRECRRRGSGNAPQGLGRGFRRRWSGGKASFIAGQVGSGTEQQVSGAG